ncbi:MAG: DNA translocase FtsK 4TM domain-containing protein, partial [Hylemonella sp.]
MTYSLNTFKDQQSKDSMAGRPGWGRYATEFVLVLGLVVLGFWLLALSSYTTQDAAWSTSGAGAVIQNRGGRLGAWVADISYFLLGYSIWWCWAAGLRAWLLSLMKWMRGPEIELASSNTLPWAHRLAQSRSGFWLGLCVLLVASSVIEWSRFHRLDAQLPGPSGGALGIWLGELGTRWLGFAGSTLVGIGLLLVGMALVFRFSWGQLAERIGSAIDAMMVSRRERREIAEDVALGQQAAREREEVVSEQREEIIEHQPMPVFIEPVLLEVPQSERVAKERQKPLFSELPDSKLPQVDLLDGSQTRLEGVSADTLEMTSRLIEKKLRDFGVEVRVVLAQPGPVITRYEIEPATGVKGAQIVNLAKDLARSL